MGCYKKVARLFLSTNFFKKMASTGLQMLNKIFVMPQEDTKTHMLFAYLHAVGKYLTAKNIQDSYQKKK